MNETCPNMRDQITGYLLDALEEDCRNAVEEHLKDCPDCRAYLQALREQEQALAALGERVGEGMTEREERVIAAAAQTRPRVPRFSFAKWAVAATLILAVGILVGRLTGPEPMDMARLKTEVRREILADVNRRMNVALADAADQMDERMRIMATQLASGSKAMMDARLTELIQIIETARRADRQHVADALVQIELSRMDDRNQIAASLRSLVTPAAEVSTPAQDAPASTNN
jgi:hypothetical protein